MKRSVDEKKIEERIILEHFSYLYDEFPGGKIIASESPDFIIRKNRKQKMGIEVTRLTRAKSRNEKFIPVPVSNNENTIIEKAREIYTSSGNSIPVFLSIIFKANVNINEDQILITAREIAGDVQNKIVQADLKTRFRFSIDKSATSAFVELIEGIYLPGVKHSAWINAAGYVVPGLSKEYLISKIKSKEQKLPLYRKKNLKMIWLLIVTDSLQRNTAFNVHNQIEAWKVKSEFDQIFLMEFLESRLYLV